MKVKIIRKSSDDVQTLGELFVFNDREEVYSCKTLELAWKKNRRRISCIPEGTYRVKKRYSLRFKNHFHILNVPGRTWILIHKGNYYTNTKGCILVGREYQDINLDGYPDVNDSTHTLSELLDILPDQFELTIKSEN